MISRVIEARHDDMRLFIEEAAGVSLYKERRRETEMRMADTRENLARLQDLRDEIDKQIRHLQRQANTARRYQELKAQERTLTAELLALRLRELDSGAAVQDSAVRECELDDAAGAGRPALGGSGDRESSASSTASWAMPRRACRAATTSSGRR
jgi:chromosome segregation protein